MTDQIDQEIEAIKNVLSALSPLSEKARTSVLDYVYKRLNLTLGENVLNPPPPGGKQQQTADQGSGQNGQEVHILTLKEQKKPRSANEMAALVGYYLGNVVPQDKRKIAINQKDIETYFKIGKFPLPNRVRMTLVNAKTAGYFDSTNEGEYKLNPVGYNLVVHSMPRTSGVSSGRSSKGVKSKKSVPKRSPTKKKKAKKSR